MVRKLRQQKVIGNERLFSLWARFSGVEKKIHWGLYRFDAPLPPREVLDRMIMGKGVFQSVTIPEGFTVKEIADLLANLQIADKDKFLAEAANPELLASVGLQDKEIEGYLFPNTYHFTPGTPARDIIMAMAEQFRRFSVPLLEQRSEAVQLSPHEIITLASIIEKETGVEAERPVVGLGLDEDGVVVAARELERVLEQPLREAAPLPCGERRHVLDLREPMVREDDAMGDRAVAVEEREPAPARPLLHQERLVDELLDRADIL